MLYYRGPYAAYAPIARANAEAAVWPIYIGKAIPSGGRKGASLSASARGTPLFKRLMEHRESVEATERATGSLTVADFQARYLTVDDLDTARGKPADRTLSSDLERGARWVRQS
nr:Eco29kI family restriction endonuclease [uncultured Sphingomonas sp.]